MYREGLDGRDLGSTILVHLVWSAWCVFCEPAEKQ